MKEIPREKKLEWKKDLIDDRIFVSEVKVSKSCTFLPALALHYSNQINMKNSMNSILHLGYDGYESLIIDKDLRSVCHFSDCALIHDRFHYCL